MKRIILHLSALLLTAVGGALPAGAQEPVVVVSVSSAERATSGVETAAGWFAMYGSADEQAQIRQMARGAVEPYLANLEQDRPLGAVVWLGPQGMPDVLAFLPLADPAPLLAMLEQQFGPAQDDGDAKVIAVAPGMPPAFIKSAGGWTYLATNPERLNNLPADPASLLGKMPELYDVGLQLNVQAVPEPLRQQMLDSAAQAVQSNIPGGGPGGPEGFDPGGIDPGGVDPAAPGAEDPFGADPAAGGALQEDPFGGDAASGAVAGAGPGVDLPTEALARYLQETDQLMLGLTVDAERSELRVDFANRAVAGTQAAEVFAAWQADKPTKLAGFYRPEAGIHGHINLQVPAGVVDNWRQQIEASLAKVLQGAGAEALSEFKFGEQLLNNGNMDMVLSVSTQRSPHLLAAAQVADEQEALAALMSVKNLLSPPGGEAAQREEEVAGAKLTVWTIALPDTPDAAEAKQLLGPTVELAIGASNGCAYLAAGPPGVVDELAKAIGGSTSEVSRSPYPKLLLLDIKKLVSGLPPTDEPGLARYVEEVSNVAGPTHVRLSAHPINGGGLYRLQIGAAAIFALAPRAAVAEEGLPPGGDPFGAPPGGDDPFGAP